MLKDRLKKFLFVFVEILIIVFTITAISTRIRVKENQFYYKEKYVASYIMKYDHLPSNFIKKEEAKRDYHNYTEAIIDGYNIGGDTFRPSKQEGYLDWIGNYEDLTGVKMYECDIYPNRDEVINKRNRGANRLVFSVDGAFVYATHNHYGQSEEPGFIKLTNYSINQTSNTFWIMDSILIVMIIGSAVYILIMKKHEEKRILIDSCINTISIVVFIIGLPFYLVYTTVKVINDKRQLRIASPKEKNKNPE